GRRPPTSPRADAARLGARGVRARRADPRANARPLAQRRPPKRPPPQPPKRPPPQLPPPPPQPPPRSHPPPLPQPPPRSHPAPPPCPSLPRSAGARFHHPPPPVALRSNALPHLDEPHDDPAERESPAHRAWASASSDDVVGWRGVVFQLPLLYRCQPLPVFR